jgi:hypothetical protein
VTNLFPLRLLTNRQHANSLTIRPPFRSDQPPAGIQKSELQIQNGLVLASCFPHFRICGATISPQFSNCYVSRLLLLSLPFYPVRLSKPSVPPLSTTIVSLSFSAHTCSLVNGRPDRYRPCFAARYSKYSQGSQPTASPSEHIY